ncbi:MAG: Asp-tRNA(Asn)/Glu-tRNA(Gln) amidotransferase subunit GatB [Candidatus Colwellbacteria bacterium CG10_big_fil_rev_8_21_14_0_10_42_22]|uniref:Aspartyl/glutamyl-tRNA(Asn/Gln) amidotransferase subunit B n=1 Tax=Candidatus Colwellbacteria bacterium CG10_big_fil_rev_8_21_14_0_10_42_22 TaxID=1974540 RepID=A0A2H0VF96_9BACT|nr:MAG: Asp-tRNA(Asn)/Glu-tRNA(Gln) amidotransferase subunit GatB [Candidatus Colwellbacteria bacterium CG10_big_fil_rev_8_21_14_0_10_42_22]
MKYKPTIGLEIHAELATKSKMFCACENNPHDAGPNTNICPVCLAHPGVLPVINKEAVKSVIKVGLAIGGKVSKHSKFDRKSYFYPDLPKGYQISQYDQPLIEGGKLAGVEIERIHLEEDTGRLSHAKDGSLVDFNRAGVPLMELVTKPVIDSSEKALEFARELQLVLRYLHVSDADMEKGQMRVEANISVSKDKKLGTKVEVKNINSFKSVKDAIASEIERQTKLLEEEEKVIQETRGWDEGKRKSFSQRIKEEANDYRYMPEPDLPPMDFSASNEINIEELKKELPELPWEKRERFKKEYGFSDGDVLERLIKDRGEAEFFEEVVSELGDKDPNKIKLAINYIDSDLVGIMNEIKSGWDDFKVTPENFAELITLINSNKVTSRVAKTVLREMFETGADPSQIINESGLVGSSDERVEEAVNKAIKNNSKAVLDYKKGKESALKFLLGQVMGDLRGTGNPERVEELLREHLSK